MHVDTYGESTSSVHVILVYKLHHIPCVVRYGIIIYCGVGIYYKLFSLEKNCGKMEQWS